MSYQSKSIKIAEGKKIKLKYIFAFRSNAAYSNIFRIAMLTERFEYAEYELLIKSKSISECVSKRLRSLFLPYLITSNTEVLFNESTSYHVDPLYMYFLILHQHVCCQLRRTTVDTIAKRIGSYHQTYATKNLEKLSKYHINKLWDQIVLRKKCPWITKDLDTYIQNFSLKRKQDTKILRLGLYYLIIKDIHRKHKITYEQRLKEQKTNYDDVNEQTPV